jgi:ABC-type uncharacterized transport system permease subunit
MPFVALLAAFAAFAYALAALGLARRLRAGESAHGATWPLLLGAAGATLHLGLHAWAGHLKGGPDLHFFAALSLVSFGMAALTVAAARLERLEALGVIVFPVAATCVMAYALVGSPEAGRSALAWPILMHAWLALLAYAALALAALFAAGLWLQERALRQRRITGLVRALPPLTQSESLLFRTLVAAFALLTLAMAIGLVFIENLFAQHLAHKTVLSLLSWAVLATLLFGHWRWGWRGAKAARWTLAAMLLLGLAFFGSRFVYEFMLAR